MPSNLHEIFTVIHELFPAKRFRRAVAPQCQDEQLLCASTQYLLTGRSCGGTWPLDPLSCGNEWSDPFSSRASPGQRRFDQAWPGSRRRHCWKMADFVPPYHGTSAWPFSTTQSFPRCVIDDHGHARWGVLRVPSPLINTYEVVPGEGSSPKQPCPGIRSSHFM